MKRNILILTMALIGLVSFNQAQAQTMVPYGIDSVVVGSQVVYEVDRDADVQTFVTSGFLSPSQFNWQISADGSIVETASGVDFGGSPLFTQNRISVGWSATGTKQITVAEFSINAANDAIVCNGADSTLTVEVLPVPTYTTDDGSNGACEAQDYNVPLTLTGYGPWTVEYEIVYTDIDGNSPPAVTDTKVVGTIADNIGTSGKSFDLPIAADELSGVGSYAITITQVDDRLTVKDQNGAIHATNAGSNAYSLYVYPTPTTGTIQHITNE